MVQGQQHKEVRIDTLIPPDIERFPWAGHLGIRMLEPVIEAVESARTTLVFTNTRSQSEIWFSRITQAKPDWARDVALHHGSIDREVRDAVEDRLRAGDIRCVVCTSSLDLGVDFSPVDQVIQIGSPKGVARLLQRAGRSGHQPGAVSRVVGVPTNAFELVEFAAARDAAQRREIESRPALNRPLDVLVQHLVTVGMGGGFDLDAMYDEVQTTHAYAGLSEQEWDWCLDFCTRGGDALKAYPEYAKLVPDPDDAGRLKVGEPRIARLHRMGIGTITSSTAMLVKLVRGRTLGTVEEGFIGKLRPGDRFVFAGQALELVRTRSMTAEVRRAKSPKGAIPTWQGGKSPLSTQLAAAVRRKLHESNRPAEDPPEDDPSIDPEMQAMAPLLQLQRRVSMLPGEGQLLLERVDTEAGHHHFLYPLQGRLVHEGLGALLAFRLARREPNTINVTVNDYGLELLTTRPLPDVEAAWREALSAEGLLDDLLACVNSSELARRRFRDIARIAGLVFQGYPGQGKSARQLQASSELFFDVLKDFDPENLLLDQARREVLDRELEVQRLRGALEALSSQELIFRRLDRLSPLSFPLFAESLREQHVSTESWEDRLRELAAQLEAQLDGEDPGNEPGAASPDSERPRVKGGRRRKRRVVKER
jgi:ATP-dependent Lhr-like helicase